MRHTLPAILALIWALPAIAAPSAEREWTFLIFLNGKNNLDSYGFQDLNEAERVGSTEKVSVVVQWASLRNRTTQRVLVTRDSDPSRVTSPPIEDLGKVDMGDWRNLVEFIRWGVRNFPAKHYFVDVWDHGSGWHKIQNAISPSDISFDDETGNAITTRQLGQAMLEASAIIGRKIDIYGSDACLMAMAEVAGEMADAVDVFVGSEEVEPAPGWDYGALLEKWNALQPADPRSVARVLADTYFASYQGGSQGRREVTFSALDLARTGPLYLGTRELGRKLLEVRNPGDRSKIVTAIQDAQSFTYSDYGDLVDFLDRIEAAQIEGLGAPALRPLREAVQEYAFVNRVSRAYSRAHGVALWLPGSPDLFESYAAKYRELKFHAETGWGDVLQGLLKTSR